MKFPDTDKLNDDSFVDHNLAWYYFIPSFAQAPEAWVDGFRLSSIKSKPTPIGVLRHLLGNLDGIINLERSFKELPEISQVYCLSNRCEIELLILFFDNFPRV